MSNIILIGSWVIWFVYFVYCLIRDIRKGDSNKIGVDLVLIFITPIAAPAIVIVALTIGFLYLLYEKGPNIILKIFKK